MTRKQVALVVWLSLPVLAVAGLCYLIAATLSMDSRTRQRAMYPPRGAGAGDTGGVNAVGEMLAGKAANHGRPAGRGEAESPAGWVHPERYERGFVLIVRDATRAHGDDQPLYVRGPISAGSTASARWVLTPIGDHEWRGEFMGHEGSPLWEFVIARGPEGPNEVLPEGEQTRILPTIEPAALVGGIRPTVTIEVTGWAVPAARGPR